MNTLPLTSEDEQLVEKAKEVIAKYYQLNKHHVTARDTRCFTVWYVP